MITRYHFAYGITEASRDIMGEVPNLRILLEYADQRANPVYTDKVLSTVFNLSVGSMY